jgi:NDP-sugar pyrophosphorylase family protein
MKYKVLLTTSGIGSRLGELTEFTNKSLVRVGDKPAISHILDQYSKDIEVVVTLGYYGDQVRDFLNLVYPNRKFTFVWVDNYKDEGSCQGLSMIQAKSHLQCPFIFNSCDTIVKYDLIPEPETNWVIGSKEESNDQYRTIDKLGNTLFRFKDKGEGLSKDLAYIGICGINDYEKFWKEIKEDSQSDCEPINAMIEGGSLFTVSETKNWIDIGSSSKLKIAKETIGSEIDVLDKPEENIYQIGDEIIKFFYDSSISFDRVVRADNHLQGITPNVIAAVGGFYKYKKVKGKPLSKTINEDRTRSFLRWALKYLWKPVDTDLKNFKSSCDTFYLKKTLQRVEKLQESINIRDKNEVINNRDCKKVSSIIEDLSKSNLLSNGIPCNFHGDCVPDNIIDEGDKFTIIDWRQNFGDSLTGDVYYDLAKFNHGMTFDIVSSENFTLDSTESGVEVDIFRSDKLERCRKVLYDFLRENDYDIKKVEILTAIIWINMAPLHEGDLKRFLFYFGKFYLNKYVS